MNNQLTYDRNKKEVARLEKCYPLFKFELKDDSLLEIHFTKNHSFSPRLENGRLDWDSERQLDNEHMQASIKQQLMGIYPHLYLNAYAHRNGLTISAWVNRNNKDVESIRSIEITSLNLHETLKQWNDEAQKAKQDGWFFCSGHLKAEPKTEYGYFHFAGQYCKRFGDENPTARKRAAQENYE